MKKSMFKTNDSVTLKKILQYLSTKGFYMVLLFCVLIIGVTGVLVTRRNMEYFTDSGVIDDEPTVDEIVDNSLTEKNEDVPVIVQDELDSIGTEKEKVIELVQEKPKKTVQAKPEPSQPKAVPEPKVIDKLLLPVEGEIILAFAKDTLVYSRTLEQWSTHDGVDIKSDRGTPVKAAADGIVEKIYNDDKMGITIIIDHGNGLKTKYCNLSTNDMVEEKKLVKKGDAISGVGNTATFEIGDQSHLHFEVIKNGENIDPMTLLPN